MSAKKTSVYDRHEGFVQGTVPDLVPGQCPCCGNRTGKRPCDEGAGCRACRIWTVCPHRQLEGGVCPGPVQCHEVGVSYPWNRELSPQQELFGD